MSLGREGARGEQNGQAERPPQVADDGWCGAVCQDYGQSGLRVFHPLLLVLAEAPCSSC